MRILIFLWLILSLSLTNPLQAAVPQAQREALLELYQQTQGDDWLENSNWLSGDPCENNWFGVLCNDDLIRELSLSDNNLTGHIPDSIGALTDLQRLSLSQNHLTGKIPAAIGNLSQLFNLYLYDNQLSGPIPTSFGNLTSVLSMYLNDNQLSGPIPDELGQMTALNVLSLFTNQLSGAIPQSMTNLSQLQLFFYEGNALYPANADVAQYLFFNSCFDTFGELECSSDYQTLAPGGFGIDSSTADSLTLTWDEVRYSQAGGYELWMADAVEGPYRLIRDTEDKTVTSHTMAGVSPDDELYIQLRSYTNPHQNNPNRVVSQAINLAGEMTSELSFPMQSPHSGSWYNPQQDGHGLVVQVLSDNLAVVYWYVFDNDGNQLWLVGAGPYDGQQIQANMAVSEGALFPPDFDTNDINKSFWGTITISFTADDRMNYAWIPRRDSGFPAGALNMQQLTRMGAGDVAGSEALNGSYSGSWFNPAQDGHGLAVEVLPNGVGLIYWYVFDSTGKPIWLLGSGQVSENRLDVSFSTVNGAQFPPNFDSNDLVPQFWGTASIEFNGCNNGLFSWQPDESRVGFSTGQMTVQRLTQLADLVCE
ncbi:hypothetical protein ACFODZ_07200 [Marinicella sediminis]|uniref:Fibronectin type-III domain-containing protein n=1 Tax=Marinicella sediminis TaxID=1792834 RepID=A0ABV7JBC6_9GAMM|nr:fibronectin type III domain-containing protein [Marinicella sediminis]